MRKTIKQYDQNPYQQTSEATVIRLVEKDGFVHVLLDQTIFYPEGGGQPSDQGTINDTLIQHVYEEEGLIYHTTECTTLQEGDVVTMTIDFCRRYDFMQQHTGEHLLSSAFENHFATKNIGFHLNESMVSIHLDKILTPEEISYGEEIALSYIKENRPIHCHYPGAENLQNLTLRKQSQSIKGEVRVVDIMGVEETACCGTHVGTTLEVGLIKILSHEKYKGGTKINFICGDRAMRDYAKKHTIITHLNRTFSSKTEELEGAILKLEQEKENLKKQLMAKNSVLYPLLVESIKKGHPEGDHYTLFGHLSHDEAKLFAKFFMKDYEGTLTLWYPIDDRIYYLISSEGEGDAKAMAIHLNSLYEGRGGGRKNQASGSIPNTPHYEKAILQGDALSLSTYFNF